MTVVNGTNSGFVTTAPTSDPSGGGQFAVDKLANALKVTCPSNINTITEMGWWSSIASEQSTYEVGIYSHDAGSDEPDILLYSSTGNVKSLDATGWQTVSGLSWKLTPGTVYWLALQVDDTASSTAVDYENSGGKHARYTNATSLRSPFDALDTGLYVLAIYALGELSTTPVDKTYSKKLVAVARNEVWYESTPGTMSELEDANSHIDTTKLLSAFEAFGKIFIVNESNKKVIDFTNVKITTDDLGANPPDFGTVLTGTSGASMIVDYITALSSTCTIYGKRITVATFSLSETVTGKDNDDNDISFVTSAAETAPPHWYDWTVYGNDTSYGVMPTKIRWACLYRGRAMLTDDPDYPHQWYLSRQFNPWDWLYAQNDAQSPVAGNDADAGEIGDITVSAIPYSDDYMVICGANNLYYMLGDPAIGGQIIELSLTDGIVAPSAFCWDGKKNLYILSTNGILRIPPGFEPPENLTETIYPDFIKDLNFDPSLQRITMGFDRTDKGILITKTTLSDGTNSNWWFDLRTEGLFPESYPNDCGVFSIFHYDAIDPDYRKFILGCNDGYLRIFDRDTKSDVTADSTQTIDSYFSSQPIELSKNPRKDGSINNIDAITVGGSDDGSESDSDDISIRVFTARSAQNIIEKISANSSPRFTQTITAPGRKKGNLSRKKARGRWAGLRVGDDTAGKSWGLERVVVDVKEKGRMT